MSTFCLEGKRAGGAIGAGGAAGAAGGDAMERSSFCCLLSFAFVSNMVLMINKNSVRKDTLNSSLLHHVQPPAVHFRFHAKCMHHRDCIKGSLLILTSTVRSGWSCDVYELPEIIPISPEPLTASGAKPRDSALKEDSGQTCHCLPLLANLRNPGGEGEQHLRKPLTLADFEENLSDVLSI